MTLYYEIEDIEMTTPVNPDDYEDSTDLYAVVIDV